MSIPSPFKPTCLTRTMLAMIFFHFSAVYFAQAQTSTLEVLDTATLEQQTDHLRQRINIYNGYRAVRDDIFLKMMKNSLDSLNAAKREIHQLESTLDKIRSDMASMDETLQRTTKDRDLAIKYKNSLTLLGIQMNKSLYNSIMWIIICGLLVLLVILFLAFKRGHIITRKTTKDLEGTREEFESYRKQSRERYEKLVMQHHKEIQQLKGNKPKYRE